MLGSKYTLKAYSVLLGEMCLNAPGNLEITPRYSVAIQ